MDCLHASRERNKFGQFLSMSRVVTPHDIADEFHQILWHLRRGSRRLTKLGAGASSGTSPKRELISFLRRTAAASAGVAALSPTGPVLEALLLLMGVVHLCHCEGNDASRLDSALGRDARIGTTGKYLWLLCLLSLRRS